MTIETLAEQARRLSSGTIASLTGKTKYDEIEAVQQDFVKFCQGEMLRYDTWQEAWSAYKG